MKILAIETSCDETAITLIDINGPLTQPKITVLGNTLLSQVVLHAQYGGVYPNLAKREHEKNLPPLLAQTLLEAGEDPNHPSIDYIAVTSGPGLEPALWVGIKFAEALGQKWNLPVVPVNHMEGHILSVMFPAVDKNSGYNNVTAQKMELPALALLVSGGHTELVYVKDFGHYEIMGQTVDDAVGEAFDKTARMLGLPYPGGPQISRLADISRHRLAEDQIKLPRPMLHAKSLDFSFSGLKTAVLYKLRSQENIDQEFKEDMARAFEDAAVEVLVEKTRKAIVQLEDQIHTLIVAGGVSANNHLALEIKKLVDNFSHITLRMPEKTLSTDNALMIGVAAFVTIHTRPETINQTPISASGRLSLNS